MKAKSCALCKQDLSDPGPDGFLKLVAEGREEITQEDYEKLWRWASLFRDKFDFQRLQGSTELCFCNFGCLMNFLEIARQVLSTEKEKVH